MKVLVDGQGADEVLLGYHFFFTYYFLDLLHEYKFLTLLNEAIIYKKAHGNLNPFIGIFKIIFSKFILKHRKFKHPFLSDQFHSKYKNRIELNPDVPTQGDVMIGHTLQKRIILCHNC